MAWEVAQDDADYVMTQLTPTSDVYVTKLTTLEDPLSSINHVVRFRYSKSAAGGDVLDLNPIQLRLNYTSEATMGTLISTVAQLVAITSVWTAGSTTLLAAEADAITDYSKLYLRFVANKP